MYKSGISGTDYDKYVERFDNRSTLSKVQQQFWQTKQKFLQKISKREDDCVIAYDAELDAKLELFKSVVDTSQRLLCVIEGYQERIFILANVESSLGRLLKECAKVNKNLIAKMLTASGKTFYYTAQQRIQLRNPLFNLYQAIETFQFKAIEDTLITIEQMEKERVAYRASLLWLKSLKLDPDSYPALEKYRKVQNHVRKTKDKYDKKKIDVVQKIDMLNASRCNLLSQALAQYQTTWLTFWSNTSYTIKSISNCFEKCQLSELNEIASLEKQTNKSKLNKDNESRKNSKETDEQDLLLLGNEAEEIKEEQKIDEEARENQFDKEMDLINVDDSIDLDLLTDLNAKDINCKNSQDQQMRKKQVDDLLTSNVNSEDLILLDDILNWSSSESNFSNTINSNLSLISQFTNFQNDKSDKNSFLSLDKKEGKIDNQSNSEKKNWFDLFSDLDMFDKGSKNTKKPMGDC